MHKTIGRTSRVDVETNVLVDCQCLEHFFTFGTIMSVEEIEPIFFTKLFSILIQTIYWSNFIINNWLKSPDMDLQ